MIRWTTAAFFAAAALVPASLWAGKSVRSEQAQPRVLPDPAAAKSPGGQLYIKQGCYQCHGLVGQGSVLSGPSLIPLRLTGSAFNAYVRQPNGVMPPFSEDILPSADLARIEAFVRTFPAPTPFERIPLLARAAASGQSSAPAQSTSAPSAPDGRLVYSQNCASCHGVAREGGIGPDLRSQGTKPLADTIKAIIDPKAPMPKLYPGAISRAEVDAVATFIRSKP